MALHALFWWIDRWRKSTAYNDLSLEAQAAYRNLLDEAWLRRGPIPNNDKILAKASGDATRWPEVRDMVLAHFRLTDEGWRNDTLDAVRSVSARRADRQARYRNSHHNGGGNSTRDAARNSGHNYPRVSGSGSGSGSRTKKNSICPHAPTCKTRHACIALSLSEARQQKPDS